MRNNRPIINEEYSIPAGLTLVSKTNLQGTITEVNDSFEIASGFSKAELIGQPHNMVRHPDVPEAVFKDMWTTLKMGATWSQVVKNRRKSGRYYWVKANASPIFQEGKPVGYISFRTTISDAEKNATMQAYQDIAAGRKKIQYGKIYSGINWPELNLFSKLEPQWQNSAVALFFSVIPFIAVANLYSISPTLTAALSALMLIAPFIYGLSERKTQNSFRKSLRLVSANEPINMSCTRPNHYVGQMINPIISTSIAVRHAIEDGLSQADEAAKLQTAINQVSSNLMIADANLQIIYMNRNMTDFMNKEEALMKRFIPNFNAKTLIGSNIDLFHKNPNQNRNLIEELTQPYLARIQLDNAHLEVNVIPIFNRAGVRTATLAEWLDKTQDHQLLQEVNGAVESAKQGLLNKRIDLAGVTGLAKQLSQAMNEMLESIEKPINDAVGVGISLSEGDLTQHMEGQYMGRFAALKDSLNVAVDNLASMMIQTKTATRAVAEGANEIKNSSLDLNARTQNQAAALEETAASMEQMTATVKHNADNARQAESATETATSQAESGVKVMDNAITSMEQIHKSSQKINDIIGLIDSIAFQTNLLALNAAVEAARAGEHGRGFAVVASEVRNLAGKSAEAAKEIRVLIEDTVKKVSEGTNHVKGSGQALNDIAGTIKNVNRIIEEIARSSNEQAEGVSQVNQAITAIDTAVQQNAALVEESTATAEGLGEMAGLMNQNVSQFIVNENAIHLGTALKTGNFDFATARRSHRQWRVKVRAYINDIDIKFDRASAADGAFCALGKWLYGHGSEYAHLTSFQALEKGHAELHAFIGKVLTLKDIGDFEQANLEMNQLEAHSTQVISLIDALENDLAKGAIQKSSKPNSPTKIAPKPTQTATIKKPATAKNPEEWDDF